MAPFAAATWCEVQVEVDGSRVPHEVPVSDLSADEGAVDNMSHRESPKKLNVDSSTRSTFSTESTITDDLDPQGVQYGHAEIEKKHSDQRILQRKTNQEEARKRKPDEDLGLESGSMKNICRGCSKEKEDEEKEVIANENIQQAPTKRDVNNNIFSDAESYFAARFECNFSDFPVCPMDLPQDVCRDFLQ